MFWKTHCAKASCGTAAPDYLHPKTVKPNFHKGFSAVSNQDEKRKNRKDVFSSVGRKIGERIIRVLDEKGNDLGLMHRAKVIKLLDEQDLRLVQRNAKAEPPEYQLMTGAQIHQERQKIRELEKAKPQTGPAGIKELTFSSNIGRHDLDTKSKQIQQWIEKKYKVQVTIKKGRNADEPENETVELFNQILQSMPGSATFSVSPQAVKGGKAFMCVFRHLNKKRRRHTETLKRLKNTLNKAEVRGSEMFYTSDFNKDRFLRKLLITAL